MTAGMLDRAAVAARVGIKPESITRYVRRGHCPKPDGFLGRTPWWRVETIDAWIAARPGHGGRPRKTPRPRPEETTP